MCQFCIEHGDGEKWYLQASTYAYDLQRDLERRGYIIDFIRDFDRNRARAITTLDLLEAMPGPIERTGKGRFQAGMLRNHFGQPVTLEDCGRIFDITTSIVRIPCVCRRFAGTSDDAYCMVVTTSPIDDVLADGFADYADGPDVSQFQRLDKSEALAMLRTCEERGLMHSVWTFKTPFIAAICNCNVASGCMAMRITRTYDTPIMWKGEYVAQIDPARCSGCADCVPRCPFDAISLGPPSRRAVVGAADCWGCGICRSACGETAISVRERAAWG